MKLVPVCLAVFAGLACSAVHAAEGFEVRYNLAGSLGGEMFAPPDRAGFGVGLAATYVHVDKVSGADGKDISVSQPGGTVRLPADTTVAPGVTLPAGTPVSW